MNKYIQIYLGFVRNDRGYLIMRSFIFKFVFKLRPPSYLYHNTHELRMMHLNETFLTSYLANSENTPPPPRTQLMMKPRGTYIYMYSRGVHVQSKCCWSERFWSSQQILAVLVSDGTE